MEENVALDSTKQKKFDKSIKGIKILIQKNQGQAAPVEDKDKTKKSKRKERGLVYLGHIPHGFYENEMTQYFKQFGMVTNVRVIRSERTGNSKGFAFVEFKETSVAQIVAETMNNYLMGKRLLKAEYIPPEKQKKNAMRKRWNTKFNPTSERRLKNKKDYNAEKTDEKELKRARKTLGNLLKTKKQLSDLGIDYNFFMPVDVPQELLPMIEAEEKIPERKVKVEKAKEEKKNKSSMKVQEIEETKEPPKKKGKVEVKKEIKGNKKDTVDNKQQKQKEQKLKEKGVKPAQNFIKLQEESNESDSSLEFDSDEYEKMLEDDDDSLSEGEGSDSDNSLEENEKSDASEVNLDKKDSEDDSDGAGSENDSESEEEPLPKVKGKKTVPLVLNPNKSRQKVKKQEVPQKIKRKGPLAPVVSPKKLKFEKQQKNPPLMKKQFKKKK